LAFVVFSFTADTVTTAVGGEEALAYDINPLVSGLGVYGYYLFSVVRLAAACVLLVIFRPDKPVERKLWRILCVAVPASVITAGSIRLCAAISNVCVQCGIELGLPKWSIILTGAAGGMTFSYFILRRQWATITGPT
jgi:hypothetical protein